MVVWQYLHISNTCGCLSINSTQGYQEGSLVPILQGSVDQVQGQDEPEATNSRHCAGNYMGRRAGHICASE